MKPSIIFLSTADFQKLMQHEQSSYQYFSSSVGVLKASICSLGIYKLECVSDIHNDSFQLLESATNYVVVGTDFQHKVWKETMLIPVGKSISYMQLAQAIGKPKACRAVANALGANKLMGIIPCHRVIGKDGSLTGFRWGIEKKKLLLASERIINNV